MTDVEILLSVDAGHTPPGAVAFFMDEDRGLRRTHAVLAILVGLGALGCLIAGFGRMPVTLMVLGAAILAIGAVRTIDDDAHPLTKRKVLVVTAQGIIARDTDGLRTWRFEDLADVVAGIHDRRPYLDLIDHSGKRHTFDCLEFRRGERARRVISSRLRLREPRLG